MKHLMMMALLSALISGCGAKITTNTYCDVSKPHFFGSEDTADWLMKNDRQFFTDTIVHNETHEKLCE